MMSAYDKAKVVFDQVLQDLIKQKGEYEEKVLLSQQSNEIKIQDKTLINFASNNYLGIANHPEIIKSVDETMKKYGYGISSVRFISGTMKIHIDLEKELTKFHQTEDTIIMSSCFDANSAIFEALLSPTEDCVISDELNHASIIDGLRLCRINKLIYKHQNMEDLEAKLKDAQKFRIRLIVFDAVFSMDGDIAPLMEIIALAEKYNAILMTDESHSIGVIGKNGKGIADHFNAYGKIHIITSTLGKSLGGGPGGYITGRKEIIQILRRKGRPYLFSNSIIPIAAGSALASINLIQKDLSIHKRLYENIVYFKEKISKLGFKILGAKDTAIVPVIIGDALKSKEFASKLMSEGIFVVSMAFPVVKLNEARLRIQISSLHTKEQLDFCLAKLEKIGKEMKLI